MATCPFRARDARPTDHRHTGGLRARLALALAWLVTTAAWAIYPAPWPDAGQPTNYEYYWTGYTMQGTAIIDLAGNADKSTGGTNPTQEADIFSGTNGNLPCVYFSYDAVNRVFFARQRLGNTPLTPTPDGGSNDDPFNSVSWSLLIDIDADGFKEFVVALNGGSGGPKAPLDRLQVYYDNARSQLIPDGALPIFEVPVMTNPSGTPASDLDPRATVWDFGYTRAINDTARGGGWLLDWQFPLTAFTVNGTPLITPTTPMALGFSTANSPNNPFQKDAAVAGTFTASGTSPYPFGDPLTPDGGITQNPFIVQPPVVTGARPSTVSVNVLDTLILNGSVVTTTVDYVDFYYLPDSDGDGTPDEGATPVYIGRANDPSATDPTLWTVTWNNQPLPNQPYLVYAVATDLTGFTGTSPNTLFTLTGTPTGVPVSGTVYNDANRNGMLDASEVSTNLAGLFVKLVRAGESTALQTVAVTQATGAFTFAQVLSGNYHLILDTNATLSDVTPTAPAGWVFSGPMSGSLPLTMGYTAVTGQNLGVWRGSTLRGTVFRDTGDVGGFTAPVANDGAQNGAEPGIAGVTVQLANQTFTAVYDTQVTDANGGFLFWIAHDFLPTALAVREVKPAGYLSTGGGAGSTGGTYTRTTDAVAFTFTAGNAYTGVAFGDVPVNTLTNDGIATVLAGASVYFPHDYTAATAGQVTFSTSHVANPVLAGWTVALVADTNGNGAYDVGEPAITGAVTLAPGEHYPLLVKVTAPAGAAVGSTNTITLSALFTYANATPALSATLTRTDVATVVPPGQPITGRLYEDANHNSQFDGAETGTGLDGLYAKLVPAAGGNALYAAGIDAATGTYSFAAVADGHYTVIISHDAVLANTTPYRPAGWLGTEAPAQVRAIIMAGVPLANINFGLWHGSMLTGITFRDTGVDGGIANNGVLDGSEAGLSGIPVQAVGPGTLGTAVSAANGAFILWLPYTAAGTVLIQTSASSAYLATDASAGTTAGAYTRATQTLAFTMVSGQTYTGVAFGFVPVNTLITSGQQRGTPGSAVFYPHTFTAGSAGVVTFTTAETINPGGLGWTTLLYRDLNGNGLIDGADALVAGGISLAAGEQVALVAKVFVPGNAPDGASHALTLSADFVYANATPALSATLTNTDLTTVATYTGLQLTKTVDRGTARPGDLITYTVTYTNVSGETLTNVVIADRTPAFTLYESATYGTLPASLTGCAVAGPGVGASGTVTWTFAGALAPGASGTVIFRVRIMQ